MTNHNIKVKKTSITKAVKLHLAQAHMIESVLVVAPDNTVKNVQTRVISEVERFDTISYIYVTNKSDKLVGVISIQELFAAKKTAKINEVMIKELVTVRRTTHRERVAVLALQNNLKSIPIVDNDNHFLGIVPSDSILSILNNAHLEDTLYSAGIYSVDNPMENLQNESLVFHIRKRFPWLLIGMTGSLLTTLVVGSYDTLLREHILLATFIPAIVYMSDAVGNQTQTIFIKTITINGKLNVLKFFLRETKIALVLGMLLSIGVFGFASIAWQQPILAFIFSVSLLLAIVGAAVMAVTLPVILRKINIDPAVASGPLASVIRDIYSLSIYLSFATLLLRLFG